MKRFMSMIFFRGLRAEVGWNFLISFEKDDWGGVHILLSITVSI